MIRFWRLSGSRGQGAAKHHKCVSQHEKKYQLIGASETKKRLAPCQAVVIDRHFDFSKLAASVTNLQNVYNFITFLKVSDLD